MLELRACDCIPDRKKKKKRGGERGEDESEERERKWWKEIETERIEVSERTGD